MGDATVRSLSIRPLQKMNPRKRAPTLPMTTSVTRGKSLTSTTIGQGLGQGEDRAGGDHLTMMES